MPKISFKAFIALSLIAIVFTPILLAKTASQLTNVFSSKESQRFDLDSWVQNNIVNTDKTQFDKEEWKSQLRKKAEEDNLDLLIIFADDELLYTERMKEPENTLLPEGDQALSENLDEKSNLYLVQSYLYTAHYNVYSADNSFIATVYISPPPIPAEEQLKSTNYDFVFYIGAFSLVSILYILFLQVNLMKPLRAINKSSQLISNGTYSIDLPSSNIKEMNYTTHAFIEMAKNLKLSKENNERLEDERKLFVSSIVHDLRTPIFSLRGYLEGLIKGLFKNEQKKTQYLEMSMKQANHLNELVTSLANYSNIEGQIKLEEITVFQVNDLLHDLKQMLFFKLSEKKLTLEVINRTSLPITGDYLLLKRGFENVLINCIRHSPPTEKIEIFIREKDSFIETIILDNGKGFAEKDLEHIFKPLYKGDEEKFSDGQRMGLGLTIAQVIIQKHSGTIQAANDVEKGAKIVIKIPKNIIE
ncbi:sensor histidine kinase [Lysinibacillus sp. NPDC056185]|uniref:HAMP domain-containing sensor histidine kinase n=2 Tax=unclassified Lysinibacillus TaxID=2636778 RepID=UPI0039F10034